MATSKQEERRQSREIIKGEIARAVDEAEAALISASTPIFERGNILVQPVRTTLPAANDQKTDAVLLRQLRVENVIYLLNKHAAAFWRFDERKRKWVDIDPPPELAASLLHRGEWKFPKISGVTTVPTMRVDGTILSHPGYDEATQLWYHPDSHLQVPAIKEQPTKEDAQAALELLKDLLSEFPFVSDVDKSVAMAALITPIVRGAFDVGPMFVLIAPAPGSGKSFLVNLAAMLATGRPCPVLTNIDSAEEMEKRLGALVLAGVSMISLDNCSCDLGGDLLCQITEQQLVRVRILGKSETPECEWRGTMFGNGNNIRLVGDMTRRGLVCNIDARMERPELRQFNRDPIKMMAARRGDYIAAALTISRAWRLSGQQEPSQVASYGKWSRAVRAPLIWLGMEDPVKSMDAAREHDPARNAARELVRLWRIHLGLNSPYTAAELIKLATENDGHPTYKLLLPELKDLLLEQAGARREIDGRKVGNWLMSIKGQIHDGCWIELVKESAHGNRYALKASTREGQQQAQVEPDPF